jgi:hypothetical protein
MLARLAERPRAVDELPEELRDLLGEDAGAIAEPRVAPERLERLTRLVEEL